METQLSLVLALTALNIVLAVCLLWRSFAKSPHTTQDLQKYLDDIYSNYLKRDLAVIIKSSAEILQNGKTYGKTLLQGNKDAADFLITQTSKLRLNPSAFKVSGNIRDDASQQRLQYLQT